MTANKSDRKQILFNCKQKKLFAGNTAKSAVLRKK